MKTDIKILRNKVEARLIKNGCTVNDAKEKVKSHFDSVLEMGETAPAKIAERVSILWGIFGTKQSNYGCD